MNHIADNQDALVDYLYEEGDPVERLTIAKHLQECAACSVAVLEFQNVRGMLRDWTPPASRPLLSPSASVTSLSAPVDQGARSGWWRGWGPATTKESSRGWGPATTTQRWRGLRPVAQAAAAVLLFASGAAFSQLNVVLEDGRLIVSTGGNERNASIVLPVERVSSGAAAQVSAPIDINEIERELRDRLESRNTSSVDTERLLQRVRAMIDQSEQRQQQQLALRLSQIAREVDTQHQADLLRIERDFGQQQEATMNYLVRTSGGAK